ncbi:MAG: phosphoribosyltransferase family protein [Patescibacteria group bacterium]|jgi:ComF family protein
MESQRFFLGRIIEPFLDAVFPRYCVSCKAEGALLCPSCFAAFDDRVFKVEDNHLTMFAYGNPIIRDLIKAYKYEFDHSAFRILQKLAEPKIETVKSFIGESILVPVPLAPLRLRERGFNQAAAVGSWLATTTGAQMHELLRREETKGHQAERTVEERETAMTRSPFRLASLLLSKEESEEVQVRGSEGGVVLIDDVWTTGSTMKAAERTLKEAGVEHVKFLTLAKG